LSLISLLLLLIICCYLPMFLFFHSKNEGPDVTLAGMLTGVGIVFVGVVVIVLRSLGAGFGSALIIMAFTGLYSAVRYKKKCIPVLKPLQVNLYTVSVTMVCAVYFLHVVIPGVLMGVGDYPAMFFNVDSPYYLGQIHSFLQSNCWPPLSLSYSGGSVGYHYGSQAVSAFFSWATNLPPHTCAFLIYTPLISLAILAIVLRISSVSSSSVVRLLTIILLLFSVFYPITDLARIMSYALNGGPFWTNFNALFFDPQLFDDGYPMLSTRSGIFLALVIFYCLEKIENLRYLILATLCTGMVIVFKSPYFVSVGLGFGLWTSVKSLQTKNVKYFLASVAALGIGLTLQTISSPAQGFKLVMAPGALFHSIRYLLNIGGTVAILLFIPMLIQAVIKKYRVDGHFLFYLFFLIPPFVLVNLFALSRNGKIELSNLLQILSLTPLFAGAMAATSLRENWATFPPFFKKTLVLLSFLVVMAPLSHKVFQIYRQITQPQEWHEYVNNGPMAEVLESIGTNGNLIVTNDFHYPAQHFRRDKRQMQIPAIFGQQAYAINFVYEHYPDSKQRLLEQQLFRSSVWDLKSEVLAKRNGWTHLLIRLAAPHPAHIPLTLINQNSEYQLFSMVKPVPSNNQ